MADDFEVKPMFEGQYHERPQFKINIQGNDYLGVMHDDEIKWFHPHPHKVLEDEHVETIESQIQEKLNNSDDIEVKPMFEGQHHERPQFKVNIQGNDYLGVLHEDEIKWFHPHPHKDFEDEHVEAVESQIQKKLNNMKD